MLVERDIEIAAGSDGALGLLLAWIDAYVVNVMRNGGRLLQDAMQFIQDVAALYRSALIHHRRPAG